MKTLTFSLVVFIVGCYDRTLSYNPTTGEMKVHSFGNLIDRNVKAPLDIEEYTSETIVVDDNKKTTTTKKITKKSIKLPYEATDKGDTASIDAVFKGAGVITNEAVKGAIEGAGKVFVPGGEE